MKVLILSASIGGGHEKAAKALKDNIISENSSNEVKIVDTLSYISFILSKTVSESYKMIVKSVPKMFDVIYKKSDEKNSFNSFVVFLNHFFSRKIIPLIKDFKPDIIVSTHMFPTEMVSYLKLRKKTFVPLICVITDYAPHKTWITKEVDAYVVASKEMIPRMLNLGIKEEKIFPFGIPIDNSFFEYQDKFVILKELNLEKDLSTILIMAGSFGVKDVLPIYTNLVKSTLNFQIVLITGKNKTLYEKLYFYIENNKEKNKNIKNTRLIYFTDEVYKFMRVSDLIITKPGGLTVSEALVSNLPLAVFDSIPGQEKENAEFLIKNKMGIRLSKSKNCLREVEELLINEDQLKIMQDSCRKHSQCVSNKSTYALIESLAKKVM